MAVTGPYTTVYDNPFTGHYIKRQTWKSTPIDKSKPLTFVYQSGETSDPVHSNARTTNPVFSGGPFSLSQLEAKVYDAVVRSLRDGSNRAQAELGTSIAEGREALSAIAKRGGQLFRLVNALKNVNPGGVLSVWNEIAREQGQLPIRRWDVFRKKYRRKCFHSRYKTVRTKTGTRRVWLNPVKGSAASWLEYWLCWAPLVGDITASQSALEKDAYYKTSTTSRAVSRIRLVNPATNYNCIAIGKFRYSLEVKNPNVDLANRLGLINVAKIAWDVVPGSFVVNYFVDIGRWLGSFTDLAGMELTSSYYTYYAKGAMSEKRTIIEGGVQTQIWIHYKGVGVIRSVGYTPAQGGFEHYASPKYGLTSITRAATAVSLLISSIRNS